MSPLLALGLAITRNAALGRPPGRGLPTEPERYRICVGEKRSRQRISGILGSFFTGFESGLRRPDVEGDVEPTVDELFHPFFHEGWAMGLAARASIRRGSWEQFRELAKLQNSDPFLFLKYVGLGFWLGFHPRGRPCRVEEIAGQFGTHGDLVLDGYGFKVGFFDLPRSRGSERSVLDRTCAQLGPGARDAFLGGFGRSRWFFSMDDPAQAFQEARSFGESVLPILGGMGLAAAFTFPDDLRRAYSAADGLSLREQPHFLKGIRIALYVRDENHPRFLDRCMEELPEEVKKRARADLDLARQVGADTREKDDFIAAFHRGCLEGRT